MNLLFSVQIIETRDQKLTFLSKMIYLEDEKMKRLEEKNLILQTLTEDMFSLCLDYQN